MNSSFVLHVFANHHTVAPRAKHLHKHFHLLIDVSHIWCPDVVCRKGRAHRDRSFVNTDIGSCRFRATRLSRICFCGMVCRVDSRPIVHRMFLEIYSASI